MDDRFRRPDQFKVIDVWVSRPTQSSPGPIERSETAVFIREEADTFVVDIEHRDGYADGGCVPSPTMLAGLMLQALSSLEP